MRSSFLAWLLLALTVCALCINVRVNAEEETAAFNPEDDEVEVNDEESTQQAATDATEEEEFEEEAGAVDEDSSRFFLYPSPDVVTSVYFPDAPEKRFTSGEDVRVLLGFQNNGNKVFNVSYIGAHLHSPFDYSLFIQNFTAYEYGLMVEPGQEMTFEYHFKASENLAATEYWLSGWVVYNSSETAIYRTYFHNSTLELVDKPTTFDLTQATSYLYMIAVLVGFGYVISWVAFSGKKSKKSSSKSVAPSNRVWETQVYTPAEKSRAVGSKKPKSKKN